MTAAPDVSRMTAAPAMLVLLLLCVCEVGVGGAQDSPPSLSDVMKEVKVLRGMVVDLRGDNAVMAARCASQKQLDALQSNMSSKLSASEAKMGEVIEAKMGEVFEAKMGEVFERLQKHKDYELVKDDLANMTERYGDLESSYHQLQTKFDQTTEQKDQLQTQFDQLQARYNETIEQKECDAHVVKDNLTYSQLQLDSACKPFIEEARRKRLCESDGFTWDGGVCYYISTPVDGSKTWAESRLYCLGKQADLIIANSSVKLDFLDRVAPSRTYVWIGLSDIDTEGTFKWVDGTALNSPMLWYPGYPSGGKGYDCGCYITYPLSSRGLLNFGCSYTYLWMCEKVVL